MAEGPQALKKDPLSEIAAPRGGLFFWCCPMRFLLLLSLLYALPRKSQALHRKFTERTGLPVALPLGELAKQNLSVIAARCHLPYRGEALAYRKVSLFARGSPTRGNGDDRRQRRKQGVAVGAAASRMQATAQQTLGAAIRHCLRSRLRGCTETSLFRKGKLHLKAGETL